MLLSEGVVLSNILLWFLTFVFSIKKFYGNVSDCSIYIHSDIAVVLCMTMAIRSSSGDLILIIIYATGSNCFGV